MGRRQFPPCVEKHGTYLTVTSEVSAEADVVHGVDWQWVVVGLCLAGAAVLFLNNLAHRLFGDKLPASDDPADREVARFLGHTGGVTTVNLTRDGSRLLSGSKDGTFRLWDVSGGAEIRRFQAPFGQVLHADLSPDGTRTLLVCNLHRFREIRALAKMAVAIVKALVTASQPASNIRPEAGRSEIVLWDLVQDQHVWSRSGPAEFNSAAFSPDGRTAAVGSFDGTVRVWDTADGAEVQCLTGHEGPTNAAFSPDGRRLLTIGHQDRLVILWDVMTGKELRRFLGHRASLFNLGFSPDGGRVITTAGEIDREHVGLDLRWVDCAARIWDAETGEERGRLVGHEAFVCHAVFSPDGRRVLTTSADKTLRLWDAASGQELHCFRGHSDVPYCSRFSPDGRYAFTAGRDATIRKWELPS